MVGEFWCGRQLGCRRPRVPDVVAMTERYLVVGAVSVMGRTFGLGRHGKKAKDVGFEWGPWAEKAMVRVDIYGGDYLDCEFFLECEKVFPNGVYVCTIASLRRFLETLPRSCLPLRRRLQANPRPADLLQTP